MRRPWCWSPSSAAPALLSAVVLAAALAAGDAAAATVLERTVEVEVRADGTLREATALRVRMDDAGDVTAWSDYGVYLDDHRRLVSLDGRVHGADGRRTPIRRRHQDRVDVSGDSFHASSRLLLLEVPALAVGAVFELDTVLEIAPYYPAGSVLLVDDDAVERLRVEVRSAAPGAGGWRWSFEGERDGLAGRALAGGGVAVDAGGLAAADGDAETVWLHYAWGDDASWGGVARWYRDLVAGLPRAAEPVRAAARRHVVDDRRLTLEALADFVQREVRYVAVEVGIGGYRPSPPGEVLDRRWGDCKDKSLLLIDLLAEAGIPAYPALALAGGERVIVDFPSPMQFNHLIVAVPASAVATGDGDAVAGGYLFVDATQPKGGARWLSPAIQDQETLVVTADGGELLRLPVLADAEGTALVVNVRLDGEGNAFGGASFRLSGRSALRVLGEIEDGAEDRLEARLRRVFARLLPGVDLGSVGWSAGEEGALSVDLSGAVKVPALVQGLGQGLGQAPAAPAAATRASLTLPALRATPELRTLAERSTPLDADPGVHTIDWHVALPAGCRPPREAEVEVANQAGSFRQTVRHRPNGFTVERRTRLPHRWYEGELLAALVEVALAENRTLRRRLRFTCGGAVDGDDEEEEAPG